MNAERREALRLKTKSGNSVPVRNVMITADELRALLADSEAKERYRGLLIDIYRDKWTDPDLMERIEKVLGEENPRRDKDDCTIGRD